MLVCICLQSVRLVFFKQILGEDGAQVRLGCIHLALVLGTAEWEAICLN